MRKLFASLLSLALFTGLYTGSVIADADRLAAVLQAQSEETQARYQYRHPQETLEFFGIQPGMTVMDGLPGRGWYTRILVPYLGREGKLIEVDYSLDLFPLFGFFSEEQLKAKKTWAETWKAEVESWEGEDKARIETFVFGSMPAEMKETADAVLMIRALHNLSRFEGQGGFLTAALQNIYDVLKPGGVVGVVQHWAPDSMSDEWAVGAKGYMKKAHVIRLMEGAGLKFTGSSDVNINPKDKPGENDFVWRLPPTLATSRENPELAGQMKAIGESNRMTLKFRKP